MRPTGFDLIYRSGTEGKREVARQGREDGSNSDSYVWSLWTNHNGACSRIPNHRLVIGDAWPGEVWSVRAWGNG